MLRLAAGRILSRFATTRVPPLAFRQLELDEIALFVGPSSLTGVELFFYVALAALLASFLLTRRMLRSPFGSVLKAIRENEQRVRFIGYDPTVYKRRAFVVSGLFATLSGALYVLDAGAVFPQAAEWLKSGEVVVMVLLGGMGTLYGPILGAFAFFGMEEWLIEYTERWRLFLGSAFILFVIFLPRGLVSVPEKLASLVPAYRGRDPGTGPTADASTGEGD